MAEMTNEELTGVLLSLMTRVGALESGGTTPTPGSSGDTELPAEWTTLATTFVDYLQDNDIYAGVVGDNVITADNAWTFFMMGVNSALLTLDRDKLEAADINAGLIRSSVLEVLNNTTIQTLMADYIKASDIVTGTLRTDTLLATVAKFCQMISDTVSATGIQSFKIDSDHVTFKDASIKNAAIESVNAGKITAGTLDTSKISIRDEDDYVVIADGLIQMCDDEIVRVQIGHIADEDDEDDKMFDMRIWDADGNMMWSASGITADAIKSAIIVDDMVAPNANISASKINIASVVQSINTQGGLTVQSTDIVVDAAGQKLSALLSTLDTWKTGIANRTSALETNITVINGKFDSYVSKTDFTNLEDDVEQLTSDYSELSQTVEGLQSTASSQTTVINTLQRTAITQSVLDAAKQSLQNQIDAIPDAYDDTQVKADIATLTTRINNWSAYDDTAILADIEDLEDALAELENYDDTEIRGLLEALRTRIGTAETNITTVQTSISNIQQTNSQISTKVQSVETALATQATRLDEIDDSTFVAEETLEATIASYSSQVTQKADAITTTVTSQVQQSIAGQYVNKTDYSRWFTESVDGLTIGSNSSPVKLQLSNDGIKFYDASTTPATEIGFWDGDMFHSRNIKVDVSYTAQFGNFEWVPKSDGTLVLRRVSAT